MRRLCFEVISTTYQRRQGSGYRENHYVACDKVGDEKYGGDFRHVSQFHLYYILRDDWAQRIGEYVHCSPTDMTRDFPELHSAIQPGSSRLLRGGTERSVVQRANPHRNGSSAVVLRRQRLERPQVPRLAMHDRSDVRRTPRSGWTIAKAEKVCRVMRDGAQSSRGADRMWCGGVAASTTLVHSLIGRSDVHVCRDSGRRDLTRSASMDEDACVSCRVMGGVYTRRGVFATSLIVPSYSHSPMFLDTTAPPGAAATLKDEFAQFDQIELPSLQRAARMLFPAALRESLRFYDLPQLTPDLSTHMEDLAWQYLTKPVECATRWRGKPELETTLACTLVDVRAITVSNPRRQSIDFLSYILFSLSSTTAQKLNCQYTHSNHIYTRISEETQHKTQVNGYISKAIHPKLEVEYAVQIKFWIWASEVGGKFG
ncbi:hypothetical protein C8F04DRAFT_1198194 [Mycena alexandri]|uniref:Uncharacterized protein n=1 Tax=Mycena alexandri TaxID=1745969 RepID=A0AAD6S0V8_9AGAR|nr:hypothetical protein C8F04DRAFT_1198194 [Mycena alexandri]